MLSDFTLNSWSLTSGGPRYCLELILVPSLCHVPRWPVRVCCLFKPPTPPPPSLLSADGVVSNFTEKTEAILPIPTSNHYLPVPIYSTFGSHPLWPTQGCCLSKCPLSPPVSSRVPSLLEKSHYRQPCYYFPIWKKKTLLTLLHPIYLFPLTAELKNCLFPLFAVSLLLFSLKPTLIRLSPPPLHQNFSSHQWLHIAQLQWTAHGPHLTALSAPFLSVFAWRVHSTLCFWRMEWGSGLMKFNVWDMNKPICKNMSYSYLPICLLWVNDDWWQSSSKEC